MASELDVVNGILAALGQEPVTALTAAAIGQSNAALKITRQLDQVRDVVLKRHGWLCALDYAELPPAQLTGYANWKYPYVYLLPAGALRVWQIGDQLCDDGFWGRHGQRWEMGTFEVDVGARLIIRAANCDDGVLQVAYVRRASWQAIDAHVADVIIAEAAVRCCRNVTGDEASNELTEMVTERFMVALGVDGTQASAEHRPPSELHRLRRFGG